MNEKIPFGAMFLGPKSENEDFLLKLLNDVVRDHVFWRRNFHTEDAPAISAHKLYGKDYQEVRSNIIQEVFRLTGALKNDIPFFSPRYLAHMSSDIMIPGIVGYIAAMLYNPNNVSWEGSPITTRLEVEVAKQLAQLMGYGNTPQELAKTWGHITSGGTTANLEAVWVAQNIKYHALAIRNAARDLGLDEFPIHHSIAHTMSVWEALNVPVEETLSLTLRLHNTMAAKMNLPRTNQEIVKKVESAITRNSFRYLGIRRFAKLFAEEGGLPETVIVIPQTKHYSWMKAPEIFGLGIGQVIQVPVNEYYRQCLTAYRRIMEQLRQRQVTPIMSVVVCGTTEVSAVDEIAPMVALRKEMEAKGLSYVLHCDAAWGGYARAVFLDSAGNFKPFAKLREEFGTWPSQRIYDSFHALQEMDSITIDPHKLGYIPYPAGAIIYKDIRVREMVTHEAPYALGEVDSEQRGEYYIGRFILEGSKPGAAAAAVWLSHKVFPLNERGYGNLIGDTIRAALYFEQKLMDLSKRLSGRYEVVVANHPTDLNIVCYFFNPSGNRSLKHMNQFNELLFQRFNIHANTTIHMQDFFVSRTTLSFAQYHSHALEQLIETHTSVIALGAADSDKLTMLRSTIMNPFVYAPTEEGNYIDKFIHDLPKFLDDVCLSSQTDNCHILPHNWKG